MYVRLRPNKSGSTTVYLIDSVRVQGKKHAVSKVVRCFGSSADQLQIDNWRREAEGLKANLARKHITSRNFTNIKSSDDIESCQVEELGLRYLYNNVFTTAFSKLNLKGLDKQMLVDLAIMRIASPVSKLRTAKLASSFGIDNFTASKIYRLMDSLDDSNINIIKRQVLENSKALIGGKVRVMFYDLTSIYFEANSQSGLKEFGFSKDGKSQHVQISLALIVTEHGLPIGYETFKGNSFEGATFIPTLNKLKEQYNVEDVTIVADSAMVSGANIDALIANNFKFIVAARVKNMNAKLTGQMLDNDGYVESGENLSYKTISLDGSTRLISVYSDDRKRKDEYDRNRALEKIRKLEGQKSKAGLRGVLKKTFVSLDKESVITIDEKKLEASRQFDGYYGFVSNTDLSPGEIIDHYKGLWQVEQAFRITKHNLKIRPVYHYVDRRIKAHFAICYLSLALVRSLEYRMKLAGVYTPIEQLHMLLNQIKEVRLNVNGQQTAIVTDIPKEIAGIFIALGLTLPKRYRTQNRV